MAVSESFEKYKHAAGGSRDDSEFHQFGGIGFCVFHIPLAHHIAEKDTSCAGCTEAEYSAEIPDNDHKGIGGYRIGTHMP